MELLERVARVLAGYRLSANAEGSYSSAALDVDAEWPEHVNEAAAVLRCLKEPSPTMVETGMAGEWSVIIQREIDALAENSLNSAS